jgi:hypothetical protein
MFPHSNHRARVSVESPTLPLPPPSPDTAALGHALGGIDGAKMREFAEQAGVVQAEAGTIARAEPPAHISPLTREDVARNNLSLRALPAHLQDIEKFVPQLQKKKPGQILKLLTERYVADPSAANAGLLQHAINRITCRGAPDAHLKREIADAVQTLHKKSSQNPAKGDDIFLWAYYDANFSGASIFADLPQGWVYWSIPYVGDAMNDAISSLTLSCTSDEVAGNVCLFENANFVGRYQNYSLTVPPGLNGYAEEDVSYVGDAFHSRRAAFRQRDLASHCRRAGAPEQDHRYRERAERCQFRGRCDFHMGHVADRPDLRFGLASQ